MQGRARRVPSGVGVRAFRHGQWRPDMGGRGQLRRHVTAYEGALVHAKGVEDELFHRRLERLPGHHGHEVPEHLEPSVAVGELSAGGGCQSRAGPAQHEVAKGIVTEPRAVPLVVGDVRQAARVAEQVADGDLLRSTVGGRELRHPLDDWRVETENRRTTTSRRGQLEDGRCDKRLGHRREVEHGLRRDRFAGDDVFSPRTPGTGRPHRLARRRPRVPRGDATARRSRRAATVTPRRRAAGPLGQRFTTRG